MTDPILRNANKSRLLLIRTGFLIRRARAVRRERNYAEAEANASIFRAVFFGGDKLSSLLSLPKIAAVNIGILLFVIKNSKVDGASPLIEGLPFAFVSERFGPRMSFTLAHEFGHLIAHHDPSTSYAVVDNESEDLGSSRKALRRMSSTLTYLLHVY